MSGRPPSKPTPSKLARLLAELAEPGSSDLLRDTVTLLESRRAFGDVCLLLEEHAGTARPRDGGGTFPQAKAWREALLASGVVADGARTPPEPLVVDDLRLYLRRDHEAEQRIVEGVRARLRDEPAASPERVRAALDEAGLLGSGAEPDWQLAAIAAGAGSRFLLLTGGPGTGKTTTVARMLSVLQALEPGLRIALCAPTGKAAARMGEAIARHAERDPRLAAIRSQLEPRTVHRLLGYRPLDDAFVHGPERKLACDVVIVDEASMLDPTLLAVLLGALPETARLILVGDRDQLAAVAAGQVLGDLSRAARPELGAGPGLSEFVSASTGMALPTQDGVPPIADAVVALRVNHRFGEQPGLDAFAKALADRDADTALEVLRHGHPDLILAEDADHALELVEPELRERIARSPREAAMALSRLAFLTAVRRGPSGTEAWNRRIERLLARWGLHTDDRWYRSRPVLVVANDHENRIYNGDLGVAARDAAGRPTVTFPTADGEGRSIPAFRLPAHQTAWAMTVHKAQGSEFDVVVLAMPDADGPLWQAPLLYTAITRARRRAIVLAHPDRLAVGLRNWPQRSSGLHLGLIDR